ncbi:MAG: hypothetical protein K8L97_11935 [Anaerolineae bacterium]|nr:hypothetical protein [Anaerolineae bacterium]
MTKIEWNPPEPRTGMLGAWDKFVGPGATSAEEWLQIIGGTALAGFLALILYLRREDLNWTGLQTLLVVVLALDLIGGVITNATSAAKRWYHRAGQDGLRAHLPFIAVHGVHLLLIAAIFRGMDWGFFLVLYGYLLAAAIIILRIPLYLQRPAALTLFCGSILLGTYLFTPTPGLEWFVPFFYLKLLVSHLLKEAPFAPEDGA